MQRQRSYGTLGASALMNIISITMLYSKRKTVKSEHTHWVRPRWGVKTCFPPKERELNSDTPIGAVPFRLVHFFFCKVACLRRKILCIPVLINLPIYFHSETSIYLHWRLFGNKLWTENVGTRVVQLAGVHSTSVSMSMIGNTVPLIRSELEIDVFKTRSERDEK